MRGGRGANRLPNTTCFAIPGKSAELSLIALDLDGIAVSSGSACSSGKVERSHVLAAMGIPAELSRGAIRVSTGWTTTEADIERFLTALSRICESRASPAWDLQLPSSRACCVTFMTSRGCPAMSRRSIHGYAS